MSELVLLKTNIPFSPLRGSFLSKLLSSTRGLGAWGFLNGSAALLWTEISALFPGISSLLLQMLPSPQALTFAFLQVFPDSLVFLQFVTLLPLDFASLGTAASTTTVSGLPPLPSSRQS